VSGATLFQIHAEKVLALSRKFGKPVPFLVMTSPATHEETVAFFHENKSFGLAEGQVHFFTQGTMPALDETTGKVLLEAPGKLFLSPNGHGGTLTALAESGLLARLKSQGVKHVFYFQVDNPLVKIGEPGFLGQHIAHGSEASSKVVFKEQPGEKVGILALVDGRCGIVEYSDMPAAMAEERAADGTLAFRAGNPAIHLFSVPFLERVTSGKDRLEYHIARKKVPHLGEPEPAGINALKFELFIFDALPHAERWLAVQTLRDEEFAPLKNASGADSLSTLQAAMLAQSKRWLRAAGIKDLEDSEVEISPLFAMDASELRNKTIMLGKRVYLK
jgi:UDP-N-acetylglucosamine/UDP-N-acetylgalactosamine diphosphorylase